MPRRRVLLRTDRQIQTWKAPASLAREMGEMIWDAYTFPGNVKALAASPACNQDQLMAYVHLIPAIAKLMADSELEMHLLHAGRRSEFSYSKAALQRQYTALFS